MPWKSFDFSIYGLKLKCINHSGTLELQTHIQFLMWDDCLLETHPKTINYKHLQVNNENIHTSRQAVKGPEIKCLDIQM